MALTVSLVDRTVFGDKKITIADVTFDSSYPTGGEALDLGLIGLTNIDFMHLPPSSGYLFDWDAANKKILVRTPVGAVAAHSHTENTAAEYTQNATTGTAGAITAGAAPEVADTTNLSTLTVRIMAYGS